MVLGGRVEVRGVGSTLGVEKEKAPEDTIILYCSCVPGGALEGAHALFCSGIAAGPWPTLLEVALRRLQVSNPATLVRGMTEKELTGETSFEVHRVEL